MPNILSTISAARQVYLLEGENLGILNYQIVSTTNTTPNLEWKLGHFGSNTWSVVRH